ncbi:hypothetical protein D3C75_1094050 [compost metagenome]
MAQLLYGDTGQNGRFHSKINPTPTTTPGKAAGISDSASTTPRPFIFCTTTSHAASRPSTPVIQAAPRASDRLVPSADNASPCWLNSAA